jgi:hypothetical protein
MNTLKIAVAAALLATASLAGAQTVVLHSSNVGIQSSNFSFGFDAQTRTITVNETWNASGPGVLEFRGLDSGSYTLIKNITNATTNVWTRFANELLDPSGQANDAQDPNPQPGFVPAGFSTSNDNDGLSFNQGGSIPRTSTIFSTVVADELSDARDFLDFENGLWGIGVNGDIRFGLTDNTGGGNQPFLLFQRPNERSIGVIPVPAALPLLASGLAIFGFIARRRKQVA